MKPGPFNKALATGFFLGMLGIIRLAHGQTANPSPANWILNTRQETVALSTRASAKSYFDPAMASPGDLVFLRVEVSGTESSISWPSRLAWPPDWIPLMDTRGQLTRYHGNQYDPLTTYLYELKIPKTAPGQYTLPAFSISCAGAPLQVPATSLTVTGDSPKAPPLELGVEVSSRALYLGQPFRVRVLLPAGPQNQIQALREIHVIGKGLMSGQDSQRESIQVVNDHGTLRPSFVADLSLIPIQSGPLTLFAQAYTAGREFGGPITIRGRVTLSGGEPDYRLLVSEPVKIAVQPVPQEGQLPGFTGAMGRFYADPPTLGTNRIHTGQPVHLQLGFHGYNEFARLVPPQPPASSDWQIVADEPPSVGFTLVPLTDTVKSTPAIPFCSFDPETGRYCDLTIPPIPVEVSGPSLPQNFRETDVGADRGSLTAMVDKPGRSRGTLVPPQCRPSDWFGALMPLFGFMLLWLWDRRRRWRAAHPDWVRRKNARKALKKIRRALNRAEADGDMVGCLALTATALKVAAAPHFPAQPDALTCSDVLVQWMAAGHDRASAATVRQIFAIADRRFSADPDLKNSPGLEQHRSALIRLVHQAGPVLDDLEGRL